MFKALKDKLKNAIKKFSKDVEEASEIVETKEETKTEEEAKTKEEAKTEDEAKTEEKAKTEEEAETEKEVKTEDEVKTEKEAKVESEEEFTFDDDESIEESKKVEEPEVGGFQQVSEQSKQVEELESIDEPEEKEEVEEIQEIVEKKSGFFGKIKSMFSKEDKIEVDEITKADKTIEADEVGKFEPLTDETDMPDEPEDKGQELTEEEIKKQVQEEIRNAEQPEEVKLKPEEVKLKPEEDEDLDEYISDLHDKSTNGVDIEETVSYDKTEAEKEFKKEEIKDFPEEDKPAGESEKGLEQPKDVPKTEAEEITELTENIEIEEPVEDLPDYKKGKDKIEDEELIIEEPEDESTEEVEKKEDQKIEETVEEPEEEQEEKKGFFSKITDIVTKTTLSNKKFDELFWEMELVLLENNVAVEVIDKIKQDLREKLVGQAIKRGQLEVEIFKTLSKSIESLFDVDKIDLIKMVKEKNKSGEPFVIAFIGVNGSGKTTTIAKVARLFQNYKLKPVIAAADTFRAAAIQQIEEHANNLGVKLIKHDYGSDPAAVAFDAIKYAKQKEFNVVLVDTAGRLHSNINLMDEMKKIIRVAKPDLKIFIGEAITGNDCVEQAKEFNDAVGIDGVILCKADVDDKGGAAISASYITGKPIMYLGMGQGYDDLKEFNKKMVMDSLELD